MLYKYKERRCTCLASRFEWSRIKCCPLLWISLACYCSKVTVWGKWGIIHATLKSSCGCFWNHVAYYYVLKSYVAHKLTIFNTAILLFCFYCSPDDETWDLSMIWHDFEKNEQRSVTCIWKEKKYCSCSIILIRIEAILSKKIYNNSENLFLKK